MTAIGDRAPRSDLAPMDHGARIERVRTAVEAAQCQALVVTKPQNIRWLTGFTGSAGTVVVTGQNLTVITDDRYQAQVHQQLAASGVAAEVVIDRILEGPVVDAVAGAGIVGLEANHISWARAREVGDWLAGSEVVPTLGLIERLRQDKDRGEIDRLALAAAITDRALARVAPTRVPGRTAREVARDLERAMIDLGADGLSFPIIVAGGPNSAKPHAAPGDRPLVPGDLVVIDSGAAVDGYGSDMTRSFLLEPIAEADLDLYRAVEAAQAAGVAAVAAGVEQRAVDAACRDSLAERDLAEAFVHGTGHGIGLEIHEEPFLSTRSTGVLRANQVVTVEPGVYLADHGGIRIEDSVVVTEGGCKAITRSPKDHRVPTV